MRDKVTKNNTIDETYHRFINTFSGYDIHILQVRENRG